MHELNDAQVASSIVWIEDEANGLSIVRRPETALEAAEFTIGELAREFGVTLRALRFYENKGLVTPRRQGSARLYSQADRTRLSSILSGKKLGFTLTEIRAMISAEEGAATANPSSSPPRSASSRSTSWRSSSSTSRPRSASCAACTPACRPSWFTWTAIHPSPRAPDAPHGLTQSPPSAASAARPWTAARGWRFFFRAEVYVYVN